MDSVSEIIERIKNLKPIKEIVENTGISQPTISAWKSRDTFPRSDDLYKIAQFCGCSMEYLLTGKESETISLNEKEKELLDNYRCLDIHSKHNVDLMVEALSGR